MPSELFNKSSNLQCGLVVSVFSKYDFDESLIIFLYPLLFLAIRGIKPSNSLYLNNIWVPIIGCVPTDDKLSENSNAPDKL